MLPACPVPGRIEKRFAKIFARESFRTISFRELILLWEGLSGASRSNGSCIGEVV
jgi:hypothetical protein